MATLPIDETCVTVREYLHSSYSPDREFVDGRLVERNLGDKWHSIVQTYLAFLFRLHRADWGVEVYAELRTRVAGMRVRIPDVLVTRAGVRFESVLETPPLIAFEILSPGDSLGDLEEKAAEYLAFGVEHIWILDPRRKMAWRADATGFQRVADGVLCVGGTPIRVDLDEIWAELERA
jgi:Uma2 family endonuclease